MQPIVKSMTPYLTKLFNNQTSIIKILPSDILKQLENYRNDFSTEDLAELALTEILNCLTKTYKQYNISSFLLTIITRQGGLDAQDLAQQLFIMYKNFLQHNSIPHKIIDIKYAETGIHQAIIQILNTELFSTFVYETGIHRIERYSPFKRQKKVYTSSIQIKIEPLFSNPSIQINTKLLTIKPIKASGPGGQYVNKTLSGVLLKYQDIIIRVNTYRSFQQNKKQALNILQSQLFYKQLQQNTKISQTLFNTYNTSNIIRTYDLVLNYIKLHTLNVKIKNVHKILKGDLWMILMYNILYATRKTCNKIV